MLVEIVPAVLRKTYEDIEKDWNRICERALHVQLDVTDGVFAGEGTFRDIARFRRLRRSEKIELHMMVHTPGNYVDSVAELSPARCIFHLESFEGTNHLRLVYETLREKTQAELALALNPESPNERLEEHLSLVDYVLFMGYNPGFANQPVNPVVFRKIGSFVDKYPDIPVAVDGHVGKDTIEPYVRAGARMLCANTAIFKEGDPEENFEQLRLLAEAVLTD